jgi:endonuclease-3
VRESQVQLKSRLLKIIQHLKKKYPDAHCALNHENAFQLLIATILSAQCTDERVNMVTPALFKKYPTPQAMAKADVKDIESLIKSTGFYKNKAKNIKACCQQIVEKFKGEVPQTLEELHSLPGVGRKTANVVLGNVFHVPSMVVDTHVTRLSNRLGLVKGRDAVKIEFALQKIVPKDEWTMYSHYMIYHGRKVCRARNPACDSCFIEKYCPKKKY